MNRFARGSTIHIGAENFLDAGGAAMTPSSVRVYITYPIGGTATRDVDYAMTEDDGVWSCEWESAISYPGTVYYSIRASGSDIVAKDGAFQLQANAANPNP